MVEIDVGFEAVVPVEDLAKSIPTSCSSILACAEFREYERLFSWVICSNGVSRLKPTISNNVTARLAT
jgi:hypothetical protein